MSSQPGPLELFRRASEHSTEGVIREYSSSFGLASKLFAARIRPDIEAIYALVRIADEVVDGTAAEAGLSVEEQRIRLDEFEAETERAMATGFSTNLVVHRFAVTARTAGIDRSLTAPFFASMRTDLEAHVFSRSELEEYIYGSAEVVGLMCLRVFLAGEDVSAERRREFEAGARRLGAAFQKINFLRDLADDARLRERCYFDGVDPEHLTESQKALLLADIDDDLDAAAAMIPLLPSSSRRAVRAAHLLFGRLSQRIRATPAEQLLTTRIRISDPQKLSIAARVLIDTGGRA